MTDPHEEVPVPPPAPDVAHAEAISMPEAVPPPPDPAPAPPVQKKPALWAREKGTPDWQFAGAVAHQRWDRDRALVITEAAYDAAVASLLTITCG